MVFGPNPASAFKVVLDPLIWPEEFSLNLRGFINQEHGLSHCRRSYMSFSSPQKGRMFTGLLRSEMFLADPCLTGEGKKGIHTIGSV